MELTISLETVCRLILRAQELEDHIPGADIDDEDNRADPDDPFGTAEDDSDSALADELRGLLDDLADDEVTEVLALALVGRGTYDASEWDEALETAADPSAETAVDQLLDMPMLSAYLEAGLAAFDLSCDGTGQID